MRLFIKDTLACAAFIFLMAATIVLTLGAKQQNQELQYKYDYMENRADSIKTLLLGHSHFANSINPHVIDSTFDLAVSARISLFDAQLAERYVPQMPHLHAVVYPLAYEQEAGAAYLNPELYGDLMYAYRRYMHLNDLPLYETRKGELSYWKKYIRRSLTYQAYYSTWKCDSLGYCSLKDEVSDTRSANFAPGSAAKVTESLKRMARVCSENGVRLIVVTNPANNTFLKHTVTKEGVDSLYSIIRSVDSLYPVEYHCYLDDPQFRDSTLFHDQTHLNHRGATLFAERVKKDFGL